VISAQRPSSRADGVAPKAFCCCDTRFSEVDELQEVNAALCKALIDEARRLVQTK
jgi:hypothetical protein